MRVSVRHSLTAQAAPLSTSACIRLRASGEGSRRPLIAVVLIIMDAWALATSTMVAVPEPLD